jgi:hypothetical protein
VINADRARELRSTGMTWREIGIALANEEGRKVPYLADPVFRVATDSRGRRIRSHDRAGIAHREAGSHD